MRPSGRHALISSDLLVLIAGEGFVRGMPVDVWDAVAEDEDPDVDRARFFFTKPAETTGAVKSANGVEGSRQLVKALILESGSNEPLDIDIYDFAASTCSFDSKSIFNIEDCVEASMYVQFELQGEYRSAASRRLSLISMNVSGVL